MIFFMLLPVLILTYLSKLYFKTQTTKKCIEGRHIVITGGSSGIGLAFAKLVAQKGAGRITLIARNEDRLIKAIEDIKSAANDSQRIEYVSCDLAEAAAATEAIHKLDEKDPIFMLVNCAGMAICGKFEEMDTQVIKQLVNVNYFAVLNPIQSVVKQMKARKDGIIIIAGSQASLFGIFGYSIYASMKFAVRGLAEALHMELKDFNISVTLALPPDTDTPGYQQENKSKPRETQLISEAAGLFKPEVVANQMYKDAMDENFFSTVGFESWILTTLCVGMTPIKYLFDLMVQVTFMGPLRMISVYYLLSFHRIITRCLDEAKQLVNKSKTQ